MRVTYKSADVVDLTDIFVVTRDAGGLLMGSLLDTAEARRAVSVNLKKYTLSATRSDDIHHDGNVTARRR